MCFRNREIREIAKRHGMHVMAHGALGKFYPEPNPLTTSHAMMMVQWSQLSSSLVLSGCTIFLLSHVSERVPFPRLHFRGGCELGAEE